MPLDGSQVRVGISGHLYVAPTGTTMPTDTATPLAVAWTELGYTETGPSIASDTNIEKFIPWQSRVAVRSVVTESTQTMTFTLWQRNSETLQLAFAGGSVVAGTAPGDFIYKAPIVVEIVERAFVLETLDGDVIDRYCLYRGTPSLNGDVSFAKDAVTGYEIQVEYLAGGAGQSPWQLITNDPAVTVTT